MYSNIHIILNKSNGGYNSINGIKDIDINKPAIIINTRLDTLKICAQNDTLRVESNAEQSKSF